MENIGITFTEDCLVRANDVLERWVCENPFPVASGLAYKGILTEVLVGLIIGIASIFIYYEKLKRK